jgi:hypothetical protein
LFKKTHDGVILKCLGEIDAYLTIYNVHSGSCGSHQAKSKEFNITCDMISRHGNGFEPPSYYDLRIKLLNQEVKSTNDALEKHIKESKTTGCTIMIDIWNDHRKRNILNFLVNSPRGTVFLKSVDASNIYKIAEKIFEMINMVVEEVGEDNVVQVMIDIAANYKVIG